MIVVCTTNRSLRRNPDPKHPTRATLPNPEYLPEHPVAHMWFMELS
jgi:hypothetical protein